MHIDSEADKIRMLIVIRTTFPPPLALLFFFLFTTEDVLLRSLTRTSMPARLSHSYNAYLYTHAWIFMMWKWNCGGKKWNSCTFAHVRAHTHTSLHGFHCLYVGNYDAAGGKTEQWVPCSGIHCEGIWAPHVRSLLTLEVMVELHLNPFCIWTTNLY